MAMLAAQNYLWKKAPFLRLLFPLMLGILLQWYLSFSLKTIVFTAAVPVLILLSATFLPLAAKYKWRAFSGFAVTTLIIITGAVLVWVNDVRHQQDWLGNKKYNEAYLLATIKEPLVEKPASLAAVVEIEGMYNDQHLKPVSGTAILYFKKDSLSQTLDYGSQILISKPLDTIKNEGNPGSFNYQRYCLFQGITHQTNLGDADYVLLPGTVQNTFYRFLYQSRIQIISIIRKYVKAPKEQGLAEALLIGYKGDLDKDLVQSYTNTGVVHIIAISGLHLGLIYWLLLLLTKPLNRKRWLWPRLIIILAGLWLFSLLAGGQPSILRSAVMFSVIAFANVLDKRSSIYNTLALSAFLLLCINPFWLWDVGFQLSYAAVLSIIIFFKPIYHLLLPQNKLLDGLWKMMAVTLAAQLLTLPVSLYHFHQFPTLFLFTNMLAIPLSSIILMGEILLCVLFFISPIAMLIGKSVEWLLRLMNTYIEGMNSVSFAVWDNILITGTQAVVLTIFIAAFAWWLQQKTKPSFWLSIVSICIFFGIQSVHFIERSEQRKLIVYNVPRYQAIDLIDGTNYTFIGDAALEQNDQLRNFHIQPTRILYGVQKTDSDTASRFVTFYNKKILVIDTALHFSNALSKEPIDVLVLSHNPKIYITDIAHRFTTRQIIIDGSVPPWKAKLWQKDCDSLHLNCYNVSEKGAFVMNIQ